MRCRVARCRLLGGVLLLVLPILCSAQLAPLWDIDHANQLARHSEVDARALALADLAAAGERGALLAGLTALKNDHSLPLPARERAMLALANQLRALSLTPAVDAALSALAAYQPGTLVAHPESHGGYGVPLFNVAGAAVGARHELMRKAATAEALALIRAGDMTLLDRFSPGLHLQVTAGYRDAFLQITDAELADWRDAVYTRLPQQAALSDLAMDITQRLPSVDGYAFLFHHADSLRLPQLAHNLSSRLDAQAAFEVLRAAAGHEKDAVGAAAISAMGPLAAHVTGVTDFLFEQLADRQLGSAAALVLAGSRDRAVLQRLQQTLAQDRAGASRAALALKMNDSAESRLLLQEFLNDAGSDHSLHQEVSQWLR